MNILEKKNGKLNVKIHIRKNIMKKMQRISEYQGSAGNIEKCINHYRSLIIGIFMFCTKFLACHISICKF